MFRNASKRVVSLLVAVIMAIGSVSVVRASDEQSSGDNTTQTPSYELTATPDPIVFPDANVGFDNANMWRDLTIRNTGTETINNIRATFAIGSTTQVYNFELQESIVVQSLEPDASITVRVRPRPYLQPSFYSDVIEITANELDEAVRVGLEFEVLGAQVVGLTLTPAEVIFNANEGFSVTDVYREFTLTNVSENDLVIADLTATLESSYFNITVNPFTADDELEAGDSAVITVVPVAGLEASDDPYEGMLVVRGEVAGESVMRIARLTLNVGAALTHEAELSPTSRTFPSADEGYNNAVMAQEFEIANIGSGGLTGLSASISAGGDYFEISQALSSASISPDGYATLSVRPRSGLLAEDSPFAGTLSITGNNGISLTAALSFSVTEPPPAQTFVIELAPASHTFTSAQQGYNNANMEQRFVIHNRGTGTITGLSHTLTGEFEISHSLPIQSIPPGGTTVIGVRPVSGLMAVNSPFAGTLTITGNNGASDYVGLSFAVTPSAVVTHVATITPSGTWNFPSRPQGFNNANMGREFIIRNTGTGTITDLTASLGNTNFQISQALSRTTLAPGETANLRVRPVSGLAHANSPFSSVLTVTGSNGISLRVDLRFTVTAPPNPNAVAWGDLNTDTHVNNVDLLYMMRYFSVPGSTIPNRPAADVNADGRLDSADLVLLLRFFAVDGVVLGPRR